MFSFRFHIFIVVMILALIMLALSFLITRAQLSDYEQTRLENRLCMELKRLTKSKLDQDNIGRVWKDMSQKLHLNRKEDLAFTSRLILSPEIMKSYSTQNWGDQFNNPSRIELQNAEKTSRSVCRISEINVADNTWIIADTEGEFGQASIVVKLNAALEEVHLVMSKSIAWLLAISVSIALFGSLLLSRLISRPVLRLQLSMQKIDKKDLHSRLESGNEFAEFQSVIRSYNEMLDRLEGSFQNASRFAANAAHELRTPLTILSIKLERAINRPNDPQTKQELSALLEEVSRLNSITQKLLFLAQAEAGTFPLQFEELNLSSIAHELVADIEMLDESALISTRIEADIQLNGDPVLLRQLLTNLLTNAVKYSVRDKSIVVDLVKRDTQCLITISNHSNVILKDERARFFGAFFRGQLAQQAHTDGTGLGLNVVSEIARLHGGKITLLDTPLHIVSTQVCLPTRLPNNSFSTSVK